MRRKQTAIGDDGRVDCALCGWRVETDADGCCPLGHRVGVVTGRAAEAAVDGGEVRALVAVGAGATAAADDDAPARILPAWQVAEAAASIGDLADDATVPPPADSTSAAADAEVPPDDAFALFDDLGGWTAPPAAPREEPVSAEAAPLDALDALGDLTAPPAESDGLSALDALDATAPFTPVDDDALKDLDALDATPAGTADVDATAPLTPVDDEPLEDLDALDALGAAPAETPDVDATAPLDALDALGDLGAAPLETADRLEATAPLGTIAPLDGLDALGGLADAAEAQDQPVTAAADDLDALRIAAVLAGVDVHDPLAAFVLAEDAAPSALDLADLPAPAAPSPAIPAAVRPAAVDADDEAGDPARRWRLVLAGALGLATGVGLVVGAVVVAPL